VLALATLAVYARGHGVSEVEKAALDALAVLDALELPQVLLQPEVLLH